VVRPGSPADLARRTPEIVRKINHMQRTIEIQRVVIDAKDRHIAHLEEHIAWLEGRA
jgi:hypothetical protein